MAQVPGRDAMGRISSMDLFGGASFDLDHDTMGRVRDLWATTTAGTVPQRHYAYDPRGRLSERTVDDRVDTYAYREPGWLIQETLDSTGPATTTTTTTHNGGGNRLTRDMVGSTSSRSDVYAYDGANRLLSLDTTLDGGTGPSTTSDLLDWDDLGGVIGDHRGNSFVRGAGGRVQELLDASGRSVQIPRDPLGRPTALTESTGAVQRLFWGNPGGSWPLAGTSPEGQAQMWVALEGMLVVFVDGDAILPTASDGRGDLLMLGDRLLGSADAFGADRDHVTATSARFVYAGMASLGDRPQLLAQHRLYDPELGRFLSEDPAAAVATTPSSTTRSSSRSVMSH